MWMAVSNLIFFQEGGCSFCFDEAVCAAGAADMLFFIYVMFLCWILLFRRNLIMESLLQLGMYSKHVEILN